MQVPCRKCRTPVELSPEAEQRARQFSEILRRLHYEPLKSGEVTVCDACKADWRAEREEVSRMTLDEIRARHAQRMREENSDDEL